MECNKNEIMTDEDKTIIVANNSENTLEREVVTNKEQTQANNKLIVKKDNSNKSTLEVVVGIGVTITGMLLAALISFVLSLYAKIDGAYEDNKIISIAVEKMNTKIESIETIKQDISKLDERIDELEKTDIGINYKLDTLIEAVNPVNIYASDAVIEEMKMIDEEDVYSSSGLMQTGLVIGKDEEGNEYLAEDVVDEKVILSYQENGRNVIFYGCINSNYAWNGHCVLNTYQNNKLVSIYEADFENGTRTAYKSLVKDGEETWIYNDRICAEENNDGMTSKMKMSFDRTMDFEVEEAKYLDVVFIESVKNVLSPLTIHSYVGRTKNGKYCDESGDAYLISYFDDGTVKTIYRGRFTDGQFNDSTGNAWSISKEIDTGYMYFKGYFENGEKIVSEEHLFINPISGSDIQGILDANHIDEKLKFDCNNIR